MAFPFFQLQPEQQEEVITKMDALEICRLKASSHHFQHLLTSPEFVTRYNSSEEDKGGVFYNFTHAQGVNELGMGDVFGRRWYDESNSLIVMNVDALLMNDVIPGDTVTLLFSCRSHFLFSRTREGVPMVLIVVNFTNRVRMLIPCPPPMQADHFIAHQRNIQMNVFAVGVELHFRILHVLFDEDLQAPRLSCYDSRFIVHGGWVMVQEVAFAAPHGVLDLDMRNEHLMILPHGDEAVLFVTIQNQVPLFASLHIDDLFNDIVNLPMTVFNVRHGWDFSAIKHYAPGGQGWAASVITHVRHGVSIIKDVSLFRFNPVHVTYRHMSSIEDEFLDEDEADALAIQAVLCEATDNIVQVGLVVNPEVNIWNVKWFVYRIDLDEWSVGVLPGYMNATRVGLPRLTSRLTI